MKERILKSGKCIGSRETTAYWNILKSDSAVPGEASIKTIKTCSNNSRSTASYTLIRESCNKIQIEAIYYRSTGAPAKPIVSSMEVMSESTIMINLANSGSEEQSSPVMYYMVTPNDGAAQRVLANSGKLYVTGLRPSTKYSFTIYAVNRDGTSLAYTSLNSVTTREYIAPVTRIATTSAPAAQVNLLSNDTAVVTIPAGATSVAVAATTLGNPSISFGSQSTAVTATITTASNPVGSSSTPFTVSGSTKIVDIDVSGLTGSATVCLDGSPTARLWHYVGGVWTDITTSHTSTQVCGVTSTFSPFTGEEPLPTPAFTLSVDSLTVDQGNAITSVTATKTGHTQTVVYTIAPALPTGLAINSSTGTISGTPTTTSSLTNYVVTATNPAEETATQSLNITVNIGQPCAEGGACALGAVGPGGGTIFYVSQVGFACGVAWSNTGSPDGGLCHYLEVAPKTWNGGSSDPARPGRVNATTTDIADILNNYTNGTGHQTRTANNADFDYLDVSQLGAGLLFSNLINTADAGATAARLARSYRPEFNFYLPTLTELNLLCQWSKGVAQVVDTQCGNGVVSEESGLGGSGNSGTYWSSSEKFIHSSGNMTAWVLVISLTNANYAPPAESFGDYGSGTWNVRPIRAF